MLCICFVLAPLDNHEIAFGYESFTAARHLRAVSLVSRHFPPLHGALRSSTAALAALCVASALTANVIRHGICGGLLRAAMRRIAIHPHLPGRMPSAERRLRRLPRLRLVSLHAGDRAFCAVIACQCFAFQRNAVQCLAIHFHCALKSHFPCARQGLKAKHCSQSVQAQRLAPILAKVRIDN